MPSNNVGSTLDDFLRETGELEEVQARANHQVSLLKAHVSESDIVYARHSVERQMERLERDSCASKAGLLQGALQALAEFGSVYDVLDSEEAFLEAARAAWKAKR